MREIFNVYCDESCYLENDGHKAMVLGVVWCPLEKSRDISVRVRNIKEKHGLNPYFEIKWTKVSPAGERFYLDLVDYFFEEADLHFRALVIPDKSKLRHKDFGQEHDDWYYKMYYQLLNVLVSSEEETYRIYLDKKDTRSAEKVDKLHEVLSNARYDFSREIIEWIQNVRAREVEMMQLADLLIGAVSYANRELTGNAGKRSLVEDIQHRTRYSMMRSTRLLEEKFNVFVWRAREAHV